MNSFFSNETSKILLSIEGNIGAGKSTFLKKLSENFNEAEVIFEPHEEWQNINGHNLLETFYKDTERWAYSFENYAFLTRVRAIENSFEKNSNKSIFFAERSVYADFYTFVKVLHQSSKINDLEWNMYKNWHLWLTKRYLKKTDAFIYLKVSPEICYERIQKRNRSEEEGIPLEYLKTLDKCHNEWLIEKKYNEYDIESTPVLVLNGEVNFENNKESLNRLINEIKDFVYEKVNFINLNKNFNKEINI